MTNAYIYARVSTEEQAKEGQSIEAQLRMCRKYADENNLEVINAFVDEGKSATTMNRQALQEMLGSLKSVSIILVQDTDRIARNTLDHLKIKALLKKNNVRLISISQPLIDDSPEGNLIDTLLAASNAFQSQITGRKTSKVMEQKAEFGWYPGGTPPLGYRNADNPNPTSSLDKRIIVFDDVTAPHIRTMFKQYASGKTNIKELAKELNELGIKSPQKSIIHPSLVSRTLQNPFYIGSFYWKKKLYSGNHEQLVDEATFNQVQKELEKRNANRSRKRKHNLLLSGLLFYKDSGNLMWGSKKIKNGKEYKHYFCGETGKGSYTSAKDLETDIEKIFRKIEISEGYKEEVLEIAKTILKENRSDKEANELRLKKELAKYKKAISEAEDDRYIRHIITSEQLVRILDKYKPLLKKVNKELGKLDINYDEKVEQLEGILILAENIGESYARAIKPLKREYLLLFFKKFWVQHGEIINYELSKDIKELIENGSVLVKSSRLPLLDSLRNGHEGQLLKINIEDTNMFNTLII
jgi:site-specific DNA recombinase